MPGSACRRSSVSPPTDTKSTTSSTVKPRTFFPPPTSRSTVVPEPLPPPSAAGSGCRSARHPSTTVTRVPRTLTTPATTGGAPGIRVGSNHGTISRTRSASAAQTRPPTRNSSSRTTPVSLIRSEEAKILQGVALSKQIQIGGRFPQGWNEIGGPFGAQVEPRAAHRMGEREPGRVQQLPRRERLEALSRLPLGRRDAPAAAEGVLPVAHDRVSDVRQMHADLVGAPGAERHAQQVRLREARGHPNVRDRVAPPREHRHALAIRGMARDRRLDVHGALRKVAPRERRVHALDLAPLDHAREAAVREVGLRDKQQTRGVAIEAVHDPGPPCGGTLCERGAAFHEYVDQRVVPVTGAGVGGGVALGRRCFGRQLDGHDGTALELDRGAKRAAVTGDAFVGDDAGGDGAGQRELVGEESVEALGFGGDDAEGHGGHQCCAAPASFARSCARPSSQREIASAIAPTVIAESATLKVGHRVLPIPTSTKSTTPWALRIRSITFPTAPAHTSARERSTNSATIASPKKIQRE